MGEDEKGWTMSGYTEIASLQYELEKLRAELAALKTENESLRKDAERYRWLKNNDSPIGIYYNADFDDCYYIHESDEAIDVAMAKGE